MKFIPRIIITPGEPAGIGPDITIQLAQKAWPAELVVIADPDMLLARAKQLKLPLTLLNCDLHAAPQAQAAGTLSILPIVCSTTVIPGLLNPDNSPYVIQTLKTATTICLQKQAAAVVTGPVHKGVINQAGIPFSGHTEFFAEQAGVKQTVMLFVVNEMKVALATTHLPLAEVPRAITKEKLKSILRILHQALKEPFQISSPHIGICGLNPHAGENGYLGREEIDVITPVINELIQEGYHLTGPLSADTIFTPKQLNQVDAVLAMYHDQALPIVKYLGFGQAVNMTLGLPFIRTSVDHGTALDLAGTGQAKAESLLAAIKLTLDLLSLTSSPLN